LFLFLALFPVSIARRHKDIFISFVFASQQSRPRPHTPTPTLKLSGQYLIVNCRMDDFQCLLAAFVHFTAVLINGKQIDTRHMGCRWHVACGMWQGAWTWQLPYWDCVKCQNLFANQSQCAHSCTVAQFHSCWILGFTVWSGVWLLHFYCFCFCYCFCFL